jgi:WD40 repeat protein
VTDQKRVLTFGLIVGCALVAAVAAAVLAVGGKHPTAATGASASAVPVSRALVSTPHIVFRDTERGAGYGRVGIVPLAHPGAKPALTGMACDRVYVAGGRGLCLRAGRGVITTYKGIIFDARTFREQHEFSLPGNPSRARVSADGRLVAYTVFVTGDGYNQIGFSTRTFIRDAATGRQLAQLEQFTTRRDGRVIHAANFNFWGVTFARDDNTFYATLGSGDKTYLVQGDIKRREMKVLREGVECPSLSPDGTRIAFKQRSGGGVGPVQWRVAVLDLATLRAHTLAETRNVDDQVEWFDDDNVVYGLPESQSSPVMDVWRIPAAGGGKPQRLMAGAWSPAVVRS